MVHKVSSSAWKGLNSDISSLKKRSKSVKEHTEELEQIVKQLDNQITPKTEKGLEQFQEGESGGK